MDPYKDVLQDLAKVYAKLKALGEPSLVNKVGSLIGHVKAARLDAIRDAEFGKDVQP